MNKKAAIVLCILIVLIGSGVGGYFIIKDINDSPKIENKESDAKKFSKEYEEVAEDNVFVYKSADEIIDILKHGTGVVYLGFPECPWCQAYVKYLHEVANEVEINKIYYTNTKKLKENDMDKYYEIVDLLEDHLQYNDEGKPWIYVPNVTFVIDGEIIANDNETSKDTKGFKKPEDYWTSEEVNSLKSKLKENMKKILEFQGVCGTGCND